MASLCVLKISLSCCNGTIPIYMNCHRRKRAIVRSRDRICIIGGIKDGSVCRAMKLMTPPIVVHLNTLMSAGSTIGDKVPIGQAYKNAAIAICRVGEVLRTIGAHACRTNDRSRMLRLWRRRRRWLRRGRSCVRRGGCRLLLRLGRWSCFFRLCSGSSSRFCRRRWRLRFCGWNRLL
jgi:hypothetical protein